MADFNPKCFKCVAEQEKQGVAGGAAGVLFGKMKQAMVGATDDEIFVCDRHK
ncbi:hypothetical protein [Spiroplasma poulsonii]|uniref:Uncharacterized protein n=1 Tax=Spiroplasma poulsonii TaxID=2138 RepID=A0A2P6FG25_9MOLU|nr:hypothetical protein [Spiroplasma poulsonii]KAF0849900.1 hypothetical protein MSROBK_023500 [Spiroplasma poulsonii]PQM32393.1 hypothetical protein SMSRO_SF023060 [Spiroplasma poulsonii]PWF95052.1 hypothetical protein SMSE_04770 [Spiroplasma poulsonii]PWF97845.1 hypothetical protein SMH99_03950 [Spiroplasma poulsonii]